MQTSCNTHPVLPGPTQAAWECQPTPSLGSTVICCLQSIVRQPDMGSSLLSHAISSPQSLTCHEEQQDPQLG